MKYFVWVGFSFVFFTYNSQIVRSEDSRENISSIRLDEETIQKGYTIPSWDGVFKLGIRRGVLSEPSLVETKRLTNFDAPLPEEKRLISDVFEFDIKNNQAFSGQKPLYLEIRFNEESYNLKKIYFWDQGRLTWRDLPSRSDNHKKIVKSLIHLPYAKLAVLDEPNILEEGKASWYKYQGCLCAASPDFAQGSILKVTNLDNNKSLKVKVNDFGPQRSIHPDRVLDLDKVAFQKIASLKKGVIPLKIEPLDSTIKITVQPDSSSASPQISSYAAIVVDDSNGQILYTKNVQEKLPIASLTKLMTVKIFLESNTPWDKIVTYQSTDEAEGARVDFLPGDEVSVKDLFYTTLVGSANNATLALTRATGISQEEFVKKMNDQAKLWELFDTQFVEPTGLNPKNVSTAEDLAILARNVFRDFRMLEATTTQEYLIKTFNTSRLIRIQNTNQLLKSDLYITGGKTGYLDEAGPCLVTKAKNRQTGQDIIALVLNSSDNGQRFEEVETLIRWGFSQI